MSKKPEDRFGGIPNQKGTSRFGGVPNTKKQGSSRFGGVPSGKDATGSGAIPNDRLPKPKPASGRQVHTRMTKTVAKAQKDGVAPGSALTKITKGDVKTDPATDQPTTREQRVKQLQTILRNHGYDVQVDGIAGPKTNSALADFHGSHPNPTKWSRANGTANAPVADLPTRQAQTKADVADGTLSSGGAPSDPSGLSLTDLQKLLKGGGINPAKYEVNPVTAAKAQADAEYGPQISQANRGITDATKQAKINLADLAKWYDAAKSIADTGASLSKTDYKNAQADNTAASQAILSAFGGNAGAGGASMANTAQNGANMLSAEGANNASFNDMLKGLISSQGADAQRDQNNRDQTNIGDMRNALTALIAAKAKSLTADTTAAKQTNLQNLLGITQANNQTDAANLNNLIGAETLPAQLTAAQLKNLSTQSLIDSRTRSAQPKNFFVNATAGDLDTAKSNIIAALKGKNFTTQQAIAAAKAAIPWKFNTPGVASRVIIPGLTLAGVTGVTPKMLGMTN